MAHWLRCRPSTNFSMIAMKSVWINHKEEVRSRQEAVTVERKPVTDEEAEEVDSLSLSSLFAKVQALYQRSQVPGGGRKGLCFDCSPKEKEEVIERALFYSSRAMDVLERAGIFSENETIQDVNTPDMRFLMIPYFHAMLLANCSDLSIRRDRLDKSCETIRRFLKLCTDLEVLQDPTFVSGCRRIIDDVKSPPADANHLRAERIARHRREKELREKLESLPQTQMKNESDTVDVELNRERLLLEVEEAILKSMNEISLFEQEKELLGFRSSMPNPTGPPVARPANSKDAGKIKTVHIPKKENTAGSEKLLRAGRVPVVGSEYEKREAIRQNVFCNPNPATMTVQEWGEIEMQRMKEQQEQQAKRKEEMDEEESRLTEEEKEERERRKKSSWDDYKDVNPRGAGNKGDHYFKR
ncbi:hypothetical protein GUITHDRAFT_165999 [Guillardia theta CCMP2712]|uniref:TAP42-like protein n=1 Tax=Guillardia theta (strain CCMP2712) TaxID=905079 RepID=L1IHQ9_GUITC|nr:hypothetical protein GUITHDRAFT_165999 [Guillardia theta CCMP2712]EKX35340.1 hypothetical protein GUITHDRAFT_165999 [Guillardia theta CCMP2712]|eukprot:XP_005822320.1 hypothetical protein GUITHDRAFT_165999 [Guillardia theta CCMP2712]